MPRSFLDHITVTAFSLETGAEWVTQSLGVGPQAGGEHPRMGTHNLLLRLGDAAFLEIIAPNPAAQAPSRPPEFDSWLQVVDSKEEKIATTNGSSQ